MRLQVFSLFVYMLIIDILSAIINTHAQFSDKLILFENHFIVWVVAFIFSSILLFYSLFDLFNIDCKVFSNL